MRIGQPYVDLPDPRPARGDSKLEKVHIRGPGVVGGFSPKDVRQGYLNDCFMPATLATMAQLMDHDLDQSFRDNGDGTYTVTFHARDRHGEVTDVEIDVDADFYQNTDGTNRYIKATHVDEKGKIELWGALFEKAYAIYASEALKEDPTYQVLNDGGYASQLMSLLTGRPAYFRTVTDAAMLWREVTRAVDGRRGVCLGTGDDGRHYKGSGLVADHSYSVLGYRIKDGEKQIQMRNPWGDTEPAGNGSNDGIFWISLTKAAKYYQSFESVV